MARPRSHVHREREQAFTIAFARTGSFSQAKQLAGIDADHIVRLMDRADFRSLAAAMLAGDAPPVVTVELEQPPGQVAA